MTHFDRLKSSGARALILGGTCLLVACGSGAAPADSTLPIESAPAPGARSSGPSTAAHEHGDHQASARMGRAGGDLTLGNGARLEIPPGALEQETEVVFSLGEEVNAFRNREDERTVGPALVVAPEVASANGAKFIVTLPYTSLPEGFTEEHVAIAFERHAEGATGFRGGATRTTWEHAAARVTPDHKLRAELDALPGMRVQFVVSN